MSDTIVYESTTGHVLGAIATPGAGAGVPPVADLVGTELPLWSGVDVTVPAERLSAAAVVPTPGLLAGPLGFGVETVGGAPRSQLLRLATWGGGGVRLDADGVTVSLPADVPDATPVLVVVAGEDGPVALLPARMTGRSLTLRLSLPDGDYVLLTLVTGYAGRLDPLTVG
ncbi:MULTISPECIES: hypothetical protein [Catenuloplanes]|uniref:Uncharacterized protein n=1 Tax=Catenuloplanes niger TaxID=587534 RepID=A0AAE4CXC2_9ACTN|nr:hypothetical protein [Catenuloplanes niger]MDR7327327.1 hypothetical protein [Catenuloplanes niger]